MSNIPDNIRKMWEAAAAGELKKNTDKPITGKPLPPEALKALEKKTSLKFNPKLTGEK